MVSMAHIEAIADNPTVQFLGQQQILRVPSFWENDVSSYCDMPVKVVTQNPGSALACGLISTATL